MAHVACNACRFSALCLSGGFDEVYIQLLRERMPSTYRLMRSRDDLVSVAIVVEQVVSQVVRQFPSGCPAKPPAVEPVVDTIETGWHSKPSVYLRLNNQTYGVSLV